jgi:hypothetical protein
VAGRLAAFIQRTQADELIVTSSIFDPAARMTSYEILADAAATAS